MSLRARLLLAVGAVAIVALTVAGVVTYLQLRSFLYNQVDDSLEQSHQIFEQWATNPGSATDLGPPPPAGGADEGSEPEDQLAAQYGAVRTPAGRTVVLYSTAFDHGHGYSPELAAHLTGFTIGPNDEDLAYLTAPSTEAGGPEFRVRAEILSRGPYSGDYLVVAQPLDETVATLHRLVVVEVAVAAAALVVASLLGWWLVRTGLRPLVAVEETAESITEGQLDERVPGANDRTEVGRLAATINVMLARIQQAFTVREATEARLRQSEERMRNFVADASHELRTPLAAVSAYAELFDRGASERPQDLERVVLGIRQETSRMGRLVEDLLLLARLDEGLPLGREPVELVALAAEAVHTARTVGPDWPVRLQASRPVEVVGDPARLRQVVDNLLANVRSHTPPGTSAVVTVAAQGDDAVVTVADDGPGMSEAQAQRVFERFYRTDPSRARHHGGVGLGLSIVASIVAAHGGTVSAAPRRPHGVAVTLRLPIQRDREPEPGLATADDRRAGVPGAHGPGAHGPGAAHPGGQPADGSTDGRATVGPARSGG